MNSAAHEGLERLIAYIVVSALGAKLFFEILGYRFITGLILDPGLPVAFASKHNDVLLMVGCCVCQRPVMVYL